MIAFMPSGTDVDKRNRAVVATTMVTGARDNALASLRLKHLDVAERQLFQDAREVRTKFRKTYPTWFFEVGEDLIEIVTSWKRFQKPHWPSDLKIPCFRRLQPALERMGRHRYLA